jgi:hypothetical protein
MKYKLYNPTNNRSISNILKYLDYKGYDLEPEDVSVSLMDTDLDMRYFPIIQTENILYVGEYKCVQFYSDATLILHLKEKAENFEKYNPSYPKNLYKIKIE